MPVVTFLHSPVGRAARLTLSLGALVALLSFADWSAFAALRDRVDVALLLAGAALTALTYPLCAWRWWLLMRAQDFALPFNRAHAITWIGQFYNAFLPGGIGGDLTRLAYAFADSPTRKARATTAMVADRLIGFAVLVLIAVFLVIFHTTGRHINVAGVPFWAVATCGIVIAGAFAPLGLPLIISRLPASFQTSLQTVARTPRINALAAAASAVVWAVDFLGGWLLSQSLGLSLSPVDISLGLAVAYLSTILPISIGGHGVREGALVLTLATLGTGLDPQQLTSLAILVWAVTLATSLLGGLVLITYRPSQTVRPEA